MLGKIEIFIIILFLVFLFYIVISFGAGQFSKNKKNLEVIVGAILMFFL